MLNNQRVILSVKYHFTIHIMIHIHNTKTHTHTCKTEYSWILWTHTHRDIEIQRCEAYGCICSFYRHHFLQNSSCFCIVPFDFQGCFCYSIPARVRASFEVATSKDAELQTSCINFLVAWLWFSLWCSGVSNVFSDFETAPASACFANVSPGAILP